MQRFGLKKFHRRSASRPFDRPAMDVTAEAELLQRRKRRQCLLDIRSQLMLLMQKELQEWEKQEKKKLYAADRARVVF